MPNPTHTGTRDPRRRPRTRRLLWALMLTTGVVGSAGIAVSALAGGDPPDVTDARESAPAPTSRAEPPVAAPPAATPVVTPAAEPVTEGPRQPDSSGEPEPAAPDLAAEPAGDAGGPQFLAGPFSSAGGEFPEGWEPLEFAKIPEHTQYRFEQEDGAWILRADADASASGFIRKVDLDLAEFPILRWRWRVKGILEKGNVAEKSGDDYPARIYIAFRYQPDRVGFFRKAQYLAGRTLFGDIPIGAINYIWASRAALGEIYDNPFAGSFVKMIPIESGATRVGEWVEEERNVYEDYRRAFGEDPPPVEGVAIMTDTDNTGEKMTAWYGDIVFRAEPSRKAP